MVDGKNIPFLTVDGWFFGHFRSFDGWRLIFRNDVYHTSLKHKFRRTLW